MDLGGGNADLIENRDKNRVGKSKEKETHERAKGVGERNGLAPATRVSQRKKTFAIGVALLLAAIIALAVTLSFRHPEGSIVVDLGGGVKLEMVQIPAGEFLMGSPAADKDAASDEKPQHRVRITSRSTWESIP